MRKIVVIIRSYFKQYWPLQIYLYTGIFLFGITLFSLIVLMIKKEPMDAEEVRFLFGAAVLYSTLFLGLHLRQLSTWPGSWLVPNFKSSHLQATAVSLSMLFFLPVLWLVLNGLPVFPLVAMLLFYSTLTLWSGYYQGQFGVSVPTLWMLAHIQENNFSSLRPSLLESSFLYEAMLFSFAALGLILFAFFYAKDKSERNPIQACGELVSKGRVGWKTGMITPITAKLAHGRLSATLRNGGPSSPWRLARLFQFGLFSPGLMCLTLPLTYFCGVVGVALIAHYLFHPIFVENSGGSAILANDFMATVIFGINILSLSTDFIQHRNRLPQLWLWAAAANRKAFSHATILSFCWVAAKQFMLTSILFFGLSFLLPGLSPTRVLAMLPLYGLLYLFVISSTLLASKWIKSRQGFGWNLVIWPGFYLVLAGQFWWMNVRKTGGPVVDAFWPATAIALLLALWLMVRAVRSWPKTQLDFLTP